MNKRLFDFYNALNPTIATLYTYTHLTSMTISSSEVFTLLHPEFNPHVHIMVPTKAISYTRLFLFKGPLPESPLFSVFSE